MEAIVTIHPSNASGLILYAEGTNGDYFSLQLYNSSAIFQYSIGSTTLNLTSAVKLGLSDWHMVAVGFDSTSSYITINNTHNSSVSIPMSLSAVNITSPLFIGGVTDSSQLPPVIKGTSGFTGCIRDLQINSATVDISIDAEAGQAVTSCPEHVCSYVQCQNGGTCSNVNTAGGNAFTCQCPDGFSGQFCETLLPLCSPSPCQYGGQCEEYGERMFTCRCPLMRKGRLCEEGN